jgi:hypothetical protein
MAGAEETAGQHRAAHSTPNLNPGAFATVTKNRFNLSRQGAVRAVHPA